MIKDPITVSSLNLCNRIVLPPMDTNKAPDGVISSEHLEHYGLRSRNGIPGLIIIEHSYIHLSGRSHEGQISVSRDTDIEGLKKLAETIHNNGSKCFMQLNHVGFKADKEATGIMNMSSSPTPNNKEQLSKEMDKEDICNVICWFKDAARRAKEAGFDGVELHSAHGYLLNQFYSPLINKRSDEYNGSIENRVRLHREVYEAVKAEVGSNYPIAIRLGGSDYCEGGSTIEDALAASKLFEEWGVDIVDISGGMGGYIYKGLDKPGYFRDLTGLIKENCSLPVILTGGVCSREDAEELLTGGYCDLVGVGRALYKDPDFAIRELDID